MNVIDITKLVEMRVAAERLVKDLGALIAEFRVLGDGTQMTLGRVKGGCADLVRAGRPIFQVLVNDSE